MLDKSNYINELGHHIDEAYCIYAITYANTLAGTTIRNGGHTSSNIFGNLAAALGVTSARATNYQGGHEPELMTRDDLYEKMSHLLVGKGK